MARHMDADAPHPHCPFCGLPMQFRRAAPKDNLGSVFPSFDCNWCGVVLNVSPRAEVLELAAPTLAPN
jgi:transposase-like protein